MAGLILFCLFLFIPLSKQHAIQDSLDKVVSSLGSIIDFFQHDYKNLNVDGLFGLRILEGRIVMRFRDKTFIALLQHYLMQLSFMYFMPYCQVDCTHLKNIVLSYWNIMSMMLTFFKISQSRTTLTASIGKNHRCQAPTSLPFTRL